jgi:hypothetical protein
MNQRPGDNVQPLRPTRGVLARALVTTPHDPAQAARELLDSFDVPAGPDATLTHIYETYQATADRIARALEDAPPMGLCDALVALRWSRAQAIAAYFEV